MNTIWHKIKTIFKMRQEGDLTAQEAEFLPAVLEVTETPPSPVGRTVLWTVMALLVVGLLWAFFGEVDEVAVATGKVIPVGQIKTIQTEGKGIIKAILVKEGQAVKRGDVLLELDQTASAADLARFKKEVAHYTLEVERLLAEQTGAIYSPDQVKDAEPKEREFQLQYYQTRMNEYRYRVSSSQSMLSQAKAALVSAQAMLERNEQQLTVAREREDRLEQLIKENAVSYFVYLEYRAKRMEWEQSVISQRAEVARQEAAVAQAESQLASTEAQWSSDIAAKLVEARKQLNAYSEELKKADEKNRYTTIVSPVDGRVNQLSVHTLGGIVTEAQPLMTIVPNDVTMEVEAWAENKDIGFIALGQTAEIKLETFNFQKYGTIEADVVDISPDAVEETKGNEKSTKFRVLLRPRSEGIFVNEKQVELMPGMTASAEIKIRTKRVIEFFLDPFRKYKSESLRER